MQELDYVALSKGIIWYLLPLAVPESPREAVLVVRKFSLLLLMIDVVIYGVFIILIYKFNFIFKLLTLIVRVEPIY